MIRIIAVSSALLASVAIAQGDQLDLVDYAKTLVSDEVNKSVVKEGSSTFFVMGGQRFKLVPMQQRDRTVRSKVTRARLSAVNAPGQPGDEPQSIAIEANESGSISADPVPKKVHAFKDYYDPRTKRDGKAPPNTLDYTAYQSPVRSQGGRGTCSAFAMTAALEAMPAFREINGNAHLSTEYAYWLNSHKNADEVCAPDGDPRSGATVTDIEDALEKDGIPLESTWEYVGTTDYCPKVDAPKEARDRAIWKPRHIYVYDADASIRAAALEKGKNKVTRTYATAVNDPRFLEAVVAAGYTMVFGFNWPDQAGIDEKMQKNDVIDLVYDKSGRAKAVPGMGHFVLLVGYKRTKGEHGGGYFIFKNSYGTDGFDGYTRLSYDLVRAFGDDGVIFTGSLRVANGGACNESLQCQGFAGAGYEGSACCKSAGKTKGTCEPTQRDFAGVWYCPNECRGDALKGPGTCKELKKDGQKCSANVDCEDFEGALLEGSACCSGKCTEMLPDWAGAYYCPGECKKAADAKAGTCDDLAEKGDSCKRNQDCDGFNGAGKKGVGCCGGECTGLRADFTGVYYCPSECRASAFSGAGTCKKIKKGKCKTDQDCKDGKSCCGGSCKKKKKDWAGVYYCPAECVGKSGGKPGSCP